MQTSHKLTHVLLALAALFVLSSSALAQITGPGATFPATSELSDQKQGSVLIYNLYSSSPANPLSENTIINITNTSSTSGAFVHLFFIDGSNCSVADAFICLTANQTVSFSMLDIDPGVMGFIIAVASDPVTGCPINFNFLIGDEYVKLASGHSANLGAEAVTAVAANPVTCAATADTATLAFNGVAFGRLPRVLAADSIPSAADASTQIVINRIGGSLITGVGNIGTIFGVFFDDIETGISFNIPFSGCQRKFIVSDSLPRLTPRFSTFVPAGRTGWAKFWVGSANNAIVGAELVNFNAANSRNLGTFSGGHNLHKLTLTDAATLDIPIFTARCF